VRRLVLLAAALVLAVSCANTAAARLYMPTYYNDPQEVAGFEANPDGSLTSLPGSPFPILSGPSFPVSGIGNLAFAPDGRRAALSYFFDGGVLGLSVSPTGALAPAQAPVEGPHQYGLAVSPDGRFAWASSVDSGGVEGIMGYAVGAGGELAPLPGSPFASGVHWDLAASPDGRFLFGTSLGGGVDRYAINPDGSLTPLGSTPVADATYLQTAPHSPLLFVGSSHAPEAGVTSFTISADGGLNQNGPRALTGEESMGFFAVSPDGSHVYMPDSNLDGIVTAAVAADGGLQVIGTMPTEDPESAAVSPDGRFLYWWQGGGSENGLRVAMIGADGLPTQLPFKTPWDSAEEERLVFQPQPVPVAQFSARPAKPGEVTEFDARGSSGAARYDWDFGDGTVLPNGGPVPSHVYAKPGAYQVTLTVSDSQGCSRQQVYTGQSTVCPGGATPITAASVETLPVLGRVRAVPKAFVPKPWGKRVKGKFGTSFRYRVNEPATVRFKIERRRQRKCGRHSVLRAPGERLCVRYQRLGSRAKESQAGANALRFTGDLHGKALPPGGYRATVVATDKSGERSEPKTVGFRVLTTP
jgi:PKD repeat protein